MSKDKSQYIESAKEILAEHKYTQLASGKGFELWDCSKPNSSSYCFNISVMPYGIAVMGDIGDFMFNYHPKGIEFLSGNDVGYYIHQKLIPIHKETEYNSDYVKEIVAGAVFDKFENDESLWELFTEDEHSKIQNDFSKREDFTFDILTEYIEKNLEAKFINPKANDFLVDIKQFLVEIEISDNEYEAYECLSSDLVIGFADDMDYDFTKTSDCLMQNLYIINEAAKAIVAQKSDTKEK